MDLSDRRDLIILGELIGSIHTAVPDVQFLLVGAMARDLLIHYGHGIQVPRATDDVDLGLAADSSPQATAVCETAGKLPGRIESMSDSPRQSNPALAH